MPKEKPDNVNQPSHYTAGRFETIEVIEDIIQHYDNPIEAFLVGTVIKYVSRAPLKGRQQEDLEKAQWYLNRLVSKQSSPVPTAADTVRNSRKSRG